MQELISAINRFSGELQAAFNNAVPPALADFIANSSAFLWGAPLLILLVGTHLYLTIRLRFIQKYIPQAIRLSITRDDHALGDISPFGALSVALARDDWNREHHRSRDGHCTRGSRSAVLLVLDRGVFGIATKYAEGVLAVRYRVTSADGEVRGGPMYAIQNGMNCKWLAIFFALMTMPGLVRGRESGAEQCGSRSRSGRVSGFRRL